MLCARDDGAANKMVVDFQRDASPRERHGGSWFQPREGGTAAFLHSSLLIVAMLLATPLAGGTLTLQQASGGIAISGVHPNFSGTLGNVNGLGVGTPSAGVSLITAGVTGGVLYTTPYVMYISGVGSNRIVIAYVSTNFTHPTALILYSCPINTSCTTFSNFSVLSTNAAAPTTIIPSPGVGNDSSSTATLGLFVANTNGAGAFTGSDSATITFVTKRVSNGTTDDTVSLTLSNETVQTAVQLLMAAAGGLSITTGSGTDYAMNFGNVNGLGVGTPTSGLNVNACSGTCPGTGEVYWTAYQLQPSFSSFASTTGQLTTYVSTNFTNFSTLQLGTVSSSGGSYAAISTSSASPTTLTASASSYVSTGNAYTGYLGLFVAVINGAGAFNGSDNAILTYTLTVP